MVLDYEKFVECWFEAIPTAVPNPAISEGWATSSLVALSIVLHPQIEPRKPANLQAIASTYNGLTPTQLLRSQTGTASSLLYNLDLFDDTLRAQYPTVLHKILRSGMYSDQQQVYGFFKKYLSAVSNTALDILMIYYSKKQTDLISDDPEQFAKFRISEGLSMFRKQVDKNAIWSQYEKAAHISPEMVSLSQKLVYKTVQQWKTVDLSVIA